MPGNDDNSNDKESGSEFRKKFEKLQADFAALQNENKGLKETNRYRDAGLDKLSDKQKRALLGLMEDPDKATAEDLRKEAMEMGWVKDDSNTNTNDNANDQQNNNGNGEGTPNVNNGEQRLEDLLGDEVKGLTAMERAHIAGMRGMSLGGSQDLEELYKEAKSLDDVKNIIRTHGPDHGIILESEID